MMLGAALALAFAAGTPSARAHHGKDFLLTETDDMPLPGHAYGLLSVDTNIDKEGGRSTEITPGLLFAVGSHIAVEPHFHISRNDSAPHEEEDDDSEEQTSVAPRHGGEEEGPVDHTFRYEASALAVRYSAGTIPGTDWRFAASAEVEKPRDSDEHTEGTGRLIFVRTFPQAMVAINVLAGTDFAAHGERSYGLGLGILAPLPNGDNAGIEVAASLPTRDGVEIVPGYYHTLNDRATVKIGVGLFKSDALTAGTLHFQMIQRF